MGKIAFTAEEAEQRVAGGEKIMLVRRETEPADIGGMHVSEGILTSTGGMTSHAAVVARGMGTPCVAGAGALHIDQDKRLVKIGGKTLGTGRFHQHRRLHRRSDGRPGRPRSRPRSPARSRTIMKWADKYRTLKVRTNGDTPTDARVAREFGAEGIGLCRTEHMFFDPQRIHHMREMILASSTEARKAALAKLLPYQREDFIGIFKAMKGLPVTIRLLDPPLHEFLPHNEKDQQELANSLNMSLDQVKARVAQLHEANPDARPSRRPPGRHVSGNSGNAGAGDHRGGVRMQEAANQRPAGDHDPAGRDEEGTGLSEDRSRRRSPTEVMREKQTKLDYLYGTMIEVPRAAVTADEMAQTARVLQLRHQRSDADDVRLQPRRRQQLPAGLSEEGDSGARSVPDASTSTASGN